MVWDTKDKENPAINTRTQITVYSRRSVGRYKLNIFVTKRRNLRIDDLRKEENVAGELFVYTIHIKADGERDKGNHLNSGNTPAPAGGRIRSVRYENFAKFLSVFWSCSATAGAREPDSRGRKTIYWRGYILHFTYDFSWPKYLIYGRQ